MSARSAVLKLLKDNVGREVTRKQIVTAAKISDWARRIRELRQEGWRIRPTKNGYILRSLTRLPKDRLDTTGISQKLRYKIIQEANGACRSCGAKVSEGVVLVVDHKIPRAWGGKTTDDNLWAICTKCNQGKRNFYSDQDAEAMRRVMAEGSAKDRILAFFKAMVGKKVDKDQLMLVARISEWARRVRELRDEGWDIVSNNEDSKLRPGEYVLRSLTQRGR